MKTSTDFPLCERDDVTRTLFRYFADKREVLFAGSVSLQEQLVGALDGAPDSVSAMGAVSAALADAAMMKILTAAG